MPDADSFRTDEYQRHNRRRQEHLATLGLNIAGRSVLEVGAGIGDHTSFFIDRGCTVTATDARPDNLVVLSRRFPGVRTLLFDVDRSAPRELSTHEVVYAYGVLYHLRRPAQGLACLANLCSAMLLLETCVSYGDELAVNAVVEDPADPTQSVCGHGCRPTRSWVLAALRANLPFAYLTKTQPWHPEFPIDWSQPTANSTGLYRSVFVGSREPIASPLLLDLITDRQERC
jgi:2-polyprenyl-3-methyl-5-hydroxy-6-metoxy-1,4-benzoquinol methylase